MQPNDNPGSQVQLRLVVAAGSIHDAPGSEGTAHFLEHMMFNGTERFPGNELIATLEGRGLRFGPEINAYTSFAETVYQLEVAATDSDVELGLDVLAEWANGALIDPTAVDAERGVIREEWRRRAETVSGRLADVIRSVVYEDTTHERRPPIGTIEAIEQIDSAVLRAYYERWYRPDLMTVIAVGDLDPRRVESVIEATFGGLTNPGEPPAQPHDDVDGPLAEPIYDVVADAELTRSEFEIRWRLNDAPIVSLADVRRDVVERVATELLFARIDERVLRGDLELLDVSVSRRPLTEDTQQLLVDVDVEPINAAVGLRSTLEELERLRQDVVTGAELERALSAIRANVVNRFSQSASRQDAAIATELIDYALTGAPSLDPEVAYQAQLDALETVQVADVQHFFDQALASPAHVMLTGPDIDAAVFPEPEELASVYEDVVGFRVAPSTPSEVAEVRTELLVAPEPIEPVETVTVDALNLTVVTYPNGARVAFRPTGVVENRIEFRAVSRGGFFAADPEVAALLGRIDSLVWQSGFESIDRVELNRLLSDSVTSVSGNVGRAVDEIQGMTTVDELETLFQLVHLHMTEATIDDIEVRRFLDSWASLAADPSRRPEVAADLVLWERRYGNSPWFRLIPTPDDLASLDIDAQLQAYRSRFDNAGDFLFVFVGDEDGRDAVFEFADRYLATLPGSPTSETAIDRDPGPPNENIVETVAVGIGEQGRININWESPFENTIENQVRAQALELVVDARIRDVVREQLGASYSPSASVSVLSEPKPWVDTTIEVNTDPERIDEVADTIRNELAAIRSGELDAAYLDRAVEQMLVDFRFFSNAEWIDLVITHLTYPDRPADEFRQRSSIAQALTMADLAATAQVVFPEQRSVEVRMVPADAGDADEGG